MVMGAIEDAYVLNPASPFSHPMDRCFDNPAPMMFNSLNSPRSSPLPTDPYPPLEPWNPIRPPPMPQRPFTTSVAP